jgi:adenosylcobinamide kinase / adenosylcobinamide-phosphate guanylyltransferase
MVRELILGGQKSGKSRRAEDLARLWLTAAPAHKAVFVATATAHDGEMQTRIARHQADRALRLPTMRTVEEPVNLAQTLVQYSAPDTLVVVDCLTLWLTNLMMPFERNATESESVPDKDGPSGVQSTEAITLLLSAIELSKGPIVIVSNEIGLGVIPMGKAVREYVDRLGKLNQDVALRCERVTLMAAGCPLILKDL